MTMQYGMARWRLAFTQSRPTLNFLVINGHPDPNPNRFCSALCSAFVNGLSEGKHLVQVLRVGQLPLMDDEPVLDVSAELAMAVEQVRAADRLFVFFPVWLGEAPPVLRALFELYVRGRPDSDADMAELREKDAQFVITASLPSLLYKRCGPKNVTTAEIVIPGLASRDTMVIGSVDSITDRDRQDWLSKVHRYGVAQGADR